MELLISAAWVVEKPSLLEIWYRFLKFILGFIVASVFRIPLCGFAGGPSPR
jgi:hypothetical protein